MQDLLKISSTVLTGATLATLMVLGACNKLKDLNPVDPPGLGVHPAGWVGPDSATFHGKHIKDSGWNLAACQECHSIDYKGGIADKSCLTCIPGLPMAVSSAMAVQTI